MLTSIQGDCAEADESSPVRSIFCMETTRRFLKVIYKFHSSVNARFCWVKWFLFDVFILLGKLTTLYELSSNASSCVTHVPGPGTFRTYIDLILFVILQYAAADPTFQMTARRTVAGQANSHPSSTNYCLEHTSFSNP